MRITSRILEALVIVATSFALAWTLAWSTPPGESWWIEMSCCILLTATAIAAERIILKQKIDYPYKPRQGATSGIALGSLTLPWVAAAIVARRFRSRQMESSLLAALFLRCSMASSTCIILFLGFISIMKRDSTNSGASLKRKKISDDGAKKKAAGNAPLYFYSQEFLVSAVLGVVLIGCIAGEAIHGGWTTHVLPSSLFPAMLGLASAFTFHAMMTALPRTFTLGEGILASSALVQTVLGALWIIKDLLLGSLTTTLTTPWNHFTSFVICMVAGCPLFAIAAVAVLRHGRRKKTGRGAAVDATAITSSQEKLIYKRVMGIAIVLLLIVLRPALWVLSFVWEDSGRLWMLAVWVGLLAVGLPVMHLLAQSGTVPNIIVRKGYHILAAALFAPALFHQPHLLGISMAIALAVLSVVEVLRLGNIPGVSSRVDTFMSSFVDSRDTGAFFITHFTLLLGLAAPIWLSNALEEEERVTEEYYTAEDSAVAVAHQLWPAALAGIIITGVGDAAASVVGSAIGRVPIVRGSKKTIEGTLASIVASLLAWGLLEVVVVSSLSIPLVHSSWVSSNGEQQVMKARAGLVGATVLASLLEASTDQLDNIFVPLQYFALVCCL